jgi:hypothetical protein
MVVNTSKIHVPEQSPTAIKNIVVTSVTGKASLPNLLKWCQAIHAGSCRFSITLDEYNQHVLVIEVAALMATRGRLEGRAWENCEADIELLKSLAGIIGDEWRTNTD